MSLGVLPNFITALLLGQWRGLLAGWKREIRQSESTIWYLAQADPGTQLSAQKNNQRIDVDFSGLLIEKRLSGCPLVTSCARSQSRVQHQPSGRLKGMLDSSIRSAGLVSPGWKLKHAAQACSAMHTSAILLVENRRVRPIGMHSE